MFFTKVLRNFVDDHDAFRISLLNILCLLASEQVNELMFQGEVTKSSVKILLQTRI